MNNDTNEEPLDVMPAFTDEEYMQAAPPVEQDEAYMETTPRGSMLGLANPYSGNLGYIMARDIVTAALRLRLARHFSKNKKHLNPTAARRLDAWAKEANPEALAEWLTKGGQDNIEKEKLEACALAAVKKYQEKTRKRLSKAFNVLNKKNEKLVPLEAFSVEVEALAWASPDRPVFLKFDIAAADVETAQAKERQQVASMHAAFDTTAKHSKIDPENPVPMLAGRDAILAAFQVLAFVPLATILDAEHPGLGSDPNKVRVAEPDPETNWLGKLTGPWFAHRVEIEEAAEADRLKREALAVPFDIRTKARTDSGNKWTAIPRAMDIAAAMGGPMFIDMNGETYAPEPHMAPVAVGRALRPRGMDIVPADWLDNPAQLALALDLDAPPEAVREYMVETATRTAHLAQFPNLCPKLLGFMFSVAPMTGRPVKGDLLGLAKWMYPDWSTGEGPTVKPWKDRRQNKRDLQALGAAFVAIKSLRLIETKPDGTRHPYDLFTIDYDLSTKPEAQVGFMINPWLVERMKGGRGGGFFLLNMTRWLALGVQNPRIFPLALRLAAIWDTARQGGIYNPDRLRPIEADRLAAECNTLPDGAAMYRAGKTDTPTAKKALSVARANMEADLDILQEAGLLGAWRPTRRKEYGKGFNFLPLPPEDYAEACKRAAAAARKNRKREKR